MFRRRLLACCLLLTALAACGDDGKPKVLETTSSAPSPTPSTSGQASAGALDRAEAESLARRYYREANTAIASGKVAALEEMSAPSCACRRLVGYIREKWSAGSIRGASFNVQQVDVLGVFPSEADVRVQLSVPAYEVLDKSGRVVERVPAVPQLKETLKLSQNRDGKWLVLNILGSSQ